MPIAHFSIIRGFQRREIINTSQLSFCLNLYQTVIFTRVAIKAFFQSKAVDLQTYFVTVFLHFSLIKPYISSLNRSWSLPARKFQLTVPRWFFSWISPIVSYVVFVLSIFGLVSPSFGRLCCVIVAFTGYLHLHVFIPRSPTVYCSPSRPGPEVIKLFFMLNSAEHEIFSANKYENANNSWHFHIY